MPEALYRKYRPQVFEDVVGQESIVHTLKNALEQNKVSHAYLFTGPRGTGKTTMARLLAKALLCQTGTGATPDGTCEDCQLIAEGTHPDVYELDAASRTGVDSVRDEIISRVGYAPTRGSYKVYIIDEVHMLSTAAFNALLKTLEEPPSHVVFVLCTTDPQKVPETIHSRCQRFDFRRIAPETMVTRLGAICVAEGVEFEGEALDLIAQRAEGGLRNALTSLEQIITYEDGKVTLAGAERLLGSIDSNDLSELMTFIGTRDAAACFRWVASYVETGADLAQFVGDMAEHVRNLYLLALAGDDAVLDVSETARQTLAHELQWFGVERASRMLGVLGDLMGELRVTSNPRLAFEIALTRLVRPESDLTLEALAQRVENLERGGSSSLDNVATLPAREAQQVAPATAPASVIETPQTEATTTTTTPESMPTPTPAVASSQPANEGASATASTTASAPATTAATTTATPAASNTEAPAAFANAAAVQRSWQQALADVKRVKQAYSALFLNVKAHYDDASNTLQIVFPAQAQFAYKAVQKPEVSSVLAAALEKVARQPVEFVIAIAQKSASAGKEKVATQSEPEPRKAASSSDAPLPPNTDAPALVDEVPDTAPPAADTADTATTATVSADGADTSDDAVDFNAVLKLGFGDDVSFEEVS